MKLLLLVAGALLLAILGRFILVARGNRLVERAIGTVATVRVPARLEPWAPTTNWLGTHLHLTRLIGTIIPGGNPAYHEDLEITQLVPDQVARRGEQLLPELFETFRSLEDISWEEATHTGARTIQHGRARYATGSHDEPARLVRVLDTELNLAITYRSLERQGPRADVMRLVDGVLDSYQQTTPLETHFASVARDLDSGIHLSLPVEFYDPFMMEFDASGARWMLFRLHPEGAEDRNRLDREVAVAAFFAPGDTSQESAARAIVHREAMQDASISAPAEAGAAGIEVSVVRHDVPGQPEPAWLVVAVDGARGVALAVRLWQRDATREETQTIVARAIASYRFDGNAADAFPSVGSGR